MLERASSGPKMRSELSTRVTHRLYDSGDILAAARHRLRDWTPGEIDAGLAAVEAARTRQEPLQAAQDTGILGHDHREPWSAYCALLALLAHAEGDVATLFSAGYVVLTHAQQSARGTKPRERCALSLLIMQHLRELPDILPIDLWREFQRVAEGGFDAVLIDAEGGVLEYQDGPAIKTIRFEAFRKKVQLLRAMSRAR